MLIRGSSVNQKSNSSGYLKSLDSHEIFWETKGNELDSTLRLRLVFLDSHWTGPGLLDSHWTCPVSDFH